MCVSLLFVFKQKTAYECRISDWSSDVCSSELAAVPVLCVAFWLPQQAAALATFSIFALASITDWLDGYLARRLNQSSEFGRCLDPIADKVLVAAALILLASSGEMLAAAELAIVIILVREFLVSGQIGRAHV